MSVASMMKDSNKPSSSCSRFRLAYNTHTLYPIPPIGPCLPEVTTKEEMPGVPRPDLGTIRDARADDHGSLPCHAVARASLRRIVRTVLACHTPAFLVGTKRRFSSRATPRRDTPPPWS